MATRPTNHRTGSAGRPHPLADPDFAKAVAQAFVDGCSRAQMCELFGLKDHDTITRWRRDPRVKVYALKLIEDRVLQVTRRVDAVIANRLEQAENMTIQELVMVRKEFLGGALRAKTESIDEGTIAEMTELLEKNPEGADIITGILNGDIPIPGIKTDG
jgi:hypothetical protein